jgi:2-keto-3-deoxy-6-phosphogluconate aldolase
MNIGRFEKQPILGILRGIARPDVLPLVETIMAAGLETIEITMNTEGAPELIASAIKAAGRRLTIGAGTVLDTESCKKAIGAGATFIVMPVLVDKVVRYNPRFPRGLDPC